MRVRPLSPNAADWHQIQQSAAFWDVNPATLDPERHRVWIVHRILQFGSWDDWRALFRLYEAAQIQDALGHRGLPAHIRHFWQTYFHEEDPLHSIPPAARRQGASSVPEWAAHTCHAIANRGARKDFIDLYALLQSGWSLTDILDAVAVQAPPLNRAHLLRSLVDFTDAEHEPDPRLLRPWSWLEIRQTIERQVYAYLRHTLPPPGPRGPRL